MNVRKKVFKALKQVSLESGYSNIVLDSVLKDDSLDDRDKRFIANLFYGVLENEQQLDYIISRMVKKGTKIEKDVRIILRIGIYQLKFMDKVPDSAAVNESVKLARECGLSRVSGFINGLLRAYIRADKCVELPKRESNELLYLSLRYSCPIWLIELWKDAYGIEICESILNSIYGRPPIYLRINNTISDIDDVIASLSESGVAVEKTAWLDNALSVKSTGSLEELDAYKNGLIHVQDLSSQICCAVLAPAEGDTILDVCAAPGGKSFTLAEIINNNGKIISCDIHDHRVRLIRNGAERLKLSCINAISRDALSKNDRYDADKVLCDVPCSGFGIIRRKPDIKNKKPESLADLPKLQYDILCSSAQNVKPGGTLIYSTCTLNPAENRNVVERFLSEHDEFVPFPLELPKSITHTLSDEPDNMLTLFPNVANTDGFFIARIKRKG